MSTYYATSVNGRMTPVPVDGWIPVFYHGRVINPRRKRRRGVAGRGLPVAKLMINGYRESRVIMPSVDCFVTPDIADKLSKVSTAELAPAVVRCVYVYPYSPGDDSYDQEPYSRSTEDVERDFYHFVSHCPKGRSSMEYVEVRPRLLSEFKGLPSNKRVRVGAPAQGAGFVDMELSAEVVNAHGILADEGLVLSEAAYAVLREHINNVFFHIEKIEL